MAKKYVSNKELKKILKKNEKSMKKRFDVELEYIKSISSHLCRLGRLTSNISKYLEFTMKNTYTPLAVETLKEYKGCSVSKKKLEKVVNKIVDEHINTFMLALFDYITSDEEFFKNLCDKKNNECLCEKDLKGNIINLSKEEYEKFRDLMIGIGIPEDVLPELNKENNEEKKVDPDKSDKEEESEEKSKHELQSEEDEEDDTVDDTVKEEIKDQVNHRPSKEDEEGYSLDEDINLLSDEVEK